MHTAATLHGVNGSQIPVGWVATGQGVPDVCARHGEPAVERRKVSISSRPPGWSYFLIFVGVLLFVIVTLVLRKTVVAPNWPFCERCKELRSRWIRTGLGLLGGAVAVLVGSTAIGVAAINDDAVSAPFLIIGNLLFLGGLIAGVVVLAQSSWRAVAAAVVSPDGHWVTVPATSENVQPLFR